MGMKINKTLLCTLLLVPALATSQPSVDLLIRHARIIDGTGNPWFYGDISIKAGRIREVSRHIDSAGAARIIDAQGLVAAPGFIDVHTHLEGGLFGGILGHPTADNFLFDGVTTAITGNCGSSQTDVAAFFHQLDSVKVSLNVATLIGHGSVREAVMGRDDRQPTPEETRRMESMVEQGMRDGAVGLSTGLIYVPGTFAHTEEVVGLARAAARYHGVYASHIRNEESQVTQAVEEAINVGRMASMGVEISHFKVGGKANWGRSRETLALVEQARKEGIDVTIDQYPYTASSTNLGARLPSWAIAGTQDSIVSRISNPAIRKKIISGMLAEIRRYQFPDFSFAVVASYGADSTFNGKSITQINRILGRRAGAPQEAETILDMMVKGGAQMVYHSMNEKDVTYIMSYPFNMAASDAGVPVQGKGMPHPRAYGTNARILGRYVRELHVMGLEEAVRRMSSLPAQKFQLTDRGLLRPGYAADLVIFDPELVTDRATFENPHQFSTGFSYVLVNGQVVIDQGIHTGVRSGTPLYGPGYSH